MSGHKNSNDFQNHFYTYIDNLIAGLDKTLPEYSDISADFYKKLEKFKHLKTPFWDSWAADICKQYVLHRAFKKTSLKDSDLNFRLYSPLVSNPVPNSINNISNCSENIHVLYDILSRKQKNIVVPGLNELFDKFKISLILILTADTKIETKIDEKSEIAMMKNISFALGPIITFNNASVKELISFSQKLDKKTSSIKDLHKIINKNPIPFLVMIWVSMHPDNNKYTPERWIKNIIKGFFG